MSDDVYHFTLTCYPLRVVSQSLTATYFRFRDDPGVYMMGTAEIVARVDGGDPGDEDDGARS
ncbi:MAG TPA: hypothetical protein VLN57_20880 [Xanthobacteraceae bacterium]|nr:hypothetical protein [Xanthobacteraceae bacterium]